MTHKPKSPRLQYCRQHDMVWSPRARKWQAVPADFIAEVRAADLLVDLVERPCPRCRRPTQP
jgi:hypothetical protein